MGEDLPYCSKKLSNYFKKKSVWSLTYRQSVFKCSRVTNIYKSFTYKMAAKTSWHRYGKKLRHCHPMYLWAGSTKTRNWTRPTTSTTSGTSTAWPCWIFMKWTWTTSANTHAWLQTGSGPARPSANWIFKVLAWFPVSKVFIDLVNGSCDMQEVSAK